MSTCLFIVVGEGVCSAACVGGQRPLAGVSSLGSPSGFQRWNSGQEAQQQVSTAEPFHWPFFFNFSFSVLEMEPRDKQSPTELYVPHSSMYLSIFETESY